MEYNIYLVDSFTDEKFKGNPAGVVPDAKRLSEDQMQLIAKELDASETAFVTSVDRDLYGVKYFSPYKKVDFCGHSTLATFYILALRGYIKPIETGIKTVYIYSNKRKLKVDIYFENNEIEHISVIMGIPKEIGLLKDRDEILKDLNLELEDINLYNKFKDIPIIELESKYAMVPLKDKKQLDNLKIDKQSLRVKLKKFGIDGLHLFYYSKDKPDKVYTRNFSMAMNLKEEPATGTANGSLIYLLKKKGLLQADRIESIQGQAMGRESKLYCTIKEKNGDYQVEVGGRGKVVMEGIIHV